MAVVVGLVGCDSSDESARESCGDNTSCSTFAPAPTPTTQERTPTTDAEPTTSAEPISTTAAQAGIVRPSVDPTLCAPLAAGDGSLSTFDLHLFAWPSFGPFTIQVIGDPAGGPTAPFALLQRYPDQLGVESRQTIDINGWNVAIAAYENGNGQAVWSLPDGSQGYMRARGLDREALVDIVASLTPSDASAAIPGFEYLPDPTTSARLELLVEHMNTGVQGRSASYQCQVAETSYIYWISTLEGDAVFQYAGVIDRPVPIEVGYQNGTLVVIQGIDDPTAPTIHDVVNADLVTWTQLLAELD